MPAVILVAVSLIVGVELAFLHKTLTRQLHLIFGNRAAVHRPVASDAATGPRPVPNLGPPAAGPITGLELRGVGPCQSGAACQLRVLASLHPQRSPQRLHWQFVVVDLCSGQEVGRPGTAAVARPDESYVDTLNNVTMPSGGSLAVIAVTTSPVRVASDPWLVGTYGACRPYAPPGAP